MIRTVFKSGNSLVVAIPSQVLDELHLHEGSEVEVHVASEKGTIEISPIEARKSGITPEFAKKVDEFIEAYRPALEALSQR
jgi:putative addiction module antidote